MTLGGTTSWGQASYPYSGPCFQGDGSTGFGTILLPAFNAWRTFSVAFTWSCTAAPGASGRIIEKGANTDWDFQSGVSNDRLAFYVGGQAVQTAAPDTTFDGKWHIIHGTFTQTSVAASGTISLYVDGILHGVPLGGVTGTATSGVLSFYQYGGGGFHTPSKIGGLWIWNNRVLTSNEVYNHALDPWQMFIPIENYWLMQGVGGGSLHRVSLDGLTYSADMTGGIRG